MSKPLKKSRAVKSICFWVLSFVTICANCQNFSLEIVSEQDEQLGQGLTYYFDQSDPQNSIEIVKDNTGGFYTTISQDDGTPFGGDQWQIIVYPSVLLNDFVTGPYPNAGVSYFRGPYIHFLRVIREANTCDEIYAQFTIYEYEYDGSDFTRLSFDFEHRCYDPNAPKLTGKFRYNSLGEPFPPFLNQDSDDIPDSIDNCDFINNSDQLDQDLDRVGDLCDDEFTNTSTFIISEPGDWVGQGETYDNNIGDSYYWGYVSNDSLYLNQISEGGHRWGFNFFPRKNSGEKLTVGTYLNAVKSGARKDGQPGMSISHQSGTCGNVIGDFFIYQIEYFIDDDEVERIKRLDMSFVQRCQGDRNIPGLVGRLKINSTFEDLIYANSFE